MEKTLSKKEKKVLEKHKARFLKNIKVYKKPAKLFAVGMVGLVGSGKSTTAKFFGEKLNAPIISSDDIRASLRAENESFKNLELLMEDLGGFILEEGYGVVFDCDLVDAGVRNKLKKVSKDMKANIFYIRTFADIDTILGRILSASEKGLKHFSRAESSWEGSHKTKVIKIREMWRRTPLHYSWRKDGGGGWVKKSMPFVFEEIDTTNEVKWRKKVGLVSRKIPGKK